MRLENFLAKKRYGLYKVLRRVRAVFFAAAVGCLTRSTASSVGGTTAAPASVLAFVWLLHRTTAVLGSSETPLP